MGAYLETFQQGFANGAKAFYEANENRKLFMPVRYTTRNFVLSPAAGRNDLSASSQKAHLHSLAHGRGKSCQDVQAKLEVVVFARR